MANLRKLTVQEAVNTDSAATWTRGTLSVSATESYVDVSNYHTIHMQPSVEGMYFVFTTSTADAIDTGTDLYLPGGDIIYSLKIPRGLGDTIYFHVERKTDSFTLNYVLG